MLFLKNKIDFLNQKSKIFNNNFLPLLLIVFYVTEAYSKIIANYSGEYSLLPRYVKLITVGYIFISLFIYQRKRLLKHIFVLVFFFIIGQFQIDCGFSFNSILTIGRYLFPIILFLFFFDTKSGVNNKKMIFKSFEMILLINSILIFLGVIFKIELFQTYSASRFGYNGLLLTSATSTYVYIITIFYFLLSFNENIKVNWRITTILLSSLLIGTKAIYLIVFIVFIYFAFIKVKSKYKYWFVALSVLLTSFIGYLFFFKFGRFNQIRLNKGLLSSVLSYRNELLLEDTIPFIKQKWTYLNYMFGGVCEFDTRSEMGIIDVIYFWGFIGGALYLWTYYKTYFTFKIDGLIIVFILALFIIISLAGNFFFYATIPVYLLILKEKILFIQENK